MNLLKVILYSIIIGWSTGGVNAQEVDSIPISDSIYPLRKNSIFFELGGNGLFYSLNYDRLFELTGKFNLSTRIGVHYTNKFPFQTLRTYAIPIEVSGLYAFYREKHHLELGCGLTYFNVKENMLSFNADITFFTARLGYRFLNPEIGSFFKIGLLTFYDWLIHNPSPYGTLNKWVLFGGVGFGYSF